MQAWSEDVLGIVARMRAFLEPGGSKRAGLKKAWAEFMGTDQARITRILENPTNISLVDYLSFCNFSKQDPCAFIRKDNDPGELPADFAKIYANIRKRMAAEQTMIIQRIEQMLRDHDRLKEIAKGERNDDQAEIPYSPHEG